MQGLTGCALSFTQERKDARIDRMCVVFESGKERNFVLNQKRKDARIDRIFGMPYKWGGILVAKGLYTKY